MKLATQVNSATLGYLAQYFKVTAAAPEGAPGVCSASLCPLQSGYGTQNIRPIDWYDHGPHHNYFHSDSKTASWNKVTLSDSESDSNSPTMLPHNLNEIVRISHLIIECLKPFGSVNKYI